MNPALFGFEDAAAFARRVAGAELDPQVDALIAQAGALRDQPETAQALLLRAQSMAPTHPAPLVALYRFHFYGHRLALARAVGEDALAIARRALGPEFGDRPPGDEQARHDPAVRFYLFALKGLAYLSLRLGDLPAAREWLAELRRLDPKDRVGGALLAHVLYRRERGGAFDEEPAPLPVQGWAVPDALR